MRDRIVQLTEAAATADEVEIELIPAGGGVFEVTRDGELIFSKKALNRFPDEKEVDAMVATSG